MIGEVRVVESVPDAFAAIVEEEVARVLGAEDAPATFRLGASGSSSGRRCFERLGAVSDLPWERIGCYFVDERCVPADSEDSNQRTLREALGPRIDQLAEFAPMDCRDGAESYDERLREMGPYHLAQLGLGPDGHTASIFPDSPARNAPPGRLVLDNVDNTGFNIHPRLTLTFEALAQIPRLVMAVMGADKAEILAKVDAGEELPASRVDSPNVLWLCDAAAAARLGGGA